MNLDIIDELKLKRITPTDPSIDQQRVPKNSRPSAGQSATMASPLKKEAIVAASAYPPASPFSNFKISAP